MSSSVRVAYIVLVFENMRAVAVAVGFRVEGFVEGLGLGDLGLSIEHDWGCG